MGLLLSILVGCVGVIELFTYFKHLTYEMKTTCAPCLSYHGPVIENPSFHDSLCNISHSNDIKLPRGARSKLENLHEYSLRVRSELKSRGFGDGSTLSEFSSQDLLGLSRADSRLSLDFDLIARDADERWDDVVELSTDRKMTTILIQVDQIRDDKLVLEEIFESNNSNNKSEDYVRISTPIPLSVTQELSRSNSSIDLSITFENDSGNELPTRDLFEHIPVVINRYNGSSSSLRSSLQELSHPCIKRIGSKSPEALSILPLNSEGDLHEETHNDNIISQDSEGKSVERATSPSAQSIYRRTRQPKGTSILRKPTRLKSKNAQVSKSAENLSRKNTKRQREPERRKSDISIQTTTSESCRDEWTNTSPTDSDRSISTSRCSSVSVHVQTNLESDEEISFKYPRSESKRDANTRTGRKSFVNKRFPKSRSLDDNYTKHIDNSENSSMPRAFNYKRHESINSRVESAAATNGWGTLTKQATEEDSFDEEFLDAEDESSTSQSGPIEYCIPSVEANKAFWVNLIFPLLFAPVHSPQTLKPINKQQHITI